jgi:hypothetical protein
MLSGLKILKIVLVFKLALQQKAFHYFITKDINYFKFCLEAAAPPCFIQQPIEK